LRLSRRILPGDRLAVKSQIFLAEPGRELFP
jgi:hypothetical protein